MQVRDARERDAPTMAELSDAPEEVLRNVVHDRSVRVLVEDAESEDGNAEGEDDTAALRGFVSFDAREDAVHVTQFGGDREACKRLLAEPISFARSEDLPVEVLLSDDDDAMRAAVEAVGFERVGQGPRFGGEPTQRYRYAPT